MCLDICIDMDLCADMCMNVCVDMCTGMCMDMHVHVCMEVCIRMCIDMRVGAHTSEPPLAGGYLFFKLSSIFLTVTYSLRPRPNIQNHAHGSLNAEMVIPGTHTPQAVCCL